MQFRNLSFIATLIALIVGRIGQAQSLPADEALFEAWQGNSQVERCGLCHYSPGNDFAGRETDFCKLIEAKLWLTNDKHAIARRRIEPISDNKIAWSAASNQLSYAIVNRLGYAVETEVGYAKFRDNCLTCHAGYQGRDDSHEFEKTATNRPGISCDVCHQIGDDTRWIDEHSGFNSKQTWRTRDPKRKAEMGMRSLISVDAQADLCLKCHIGDIKQNMFVTHRMYAAGHPPLPSVELASMLDAMPRHWRTNAELYHSLKNYPERELYYEQNFGIEVDDDSKPIDQLNWNAQSVVIGALAAQQQYLSIVEQAASPNSQRWGDFALYDCASCHHELKEPSQRQVARVRSIPGLPRLADWPHALSDAALASIGDSSQFQQAQSALHLAVAETQFGNRKLVAQTASEFSSRLSLFRATIKNEALNPVNVNRFLVALANTPEAQLVDYHAARQINWAMRVIDAELLSLGRPLPDDVRERIAKLGIESGETRVESDIPGGQLREIFPSFIETELTRQSHFDSQKFHGQLKSIFDP